MRQCPILMYHWFRPSDTASRSRSPQLEIAPELFARQMWSLKRRGFETVSLARASGCDRRLRLPPRPLVVSFDDGTLDFWQHARQVLLACGFRASLFVVTDKVGGSSDWDLAAGEPARPLMSWEQLMTLAAEGFEIGSHTCTHRSLTQLDEAEARAELTRSRATLAERLGVAPACLAFPRGHYAPLHRRLARETGYRAACAVILRWRDLARADPFALQRMTIKGSEGMARFHLRLLLAGLVPLASADG